MEEGIQISAEVLQQMLAESRHNPTIECCGLLASRDSIISAIFPAQNAHPSPETNFEIAPQQLFSLMKEIRAQGLELRGIYHSHPQTESSPSPTDLARACYPDAAYFIISTSPNAHKTIRAFRIRDGLATELSIGMIT